MYIYKVEIACVGTRYIIGINRSDKFKFGYGLMIFEIVIPFELRKRI
jgi:hypothetical protein